MSTDTAIEWTDKTWNPVTGCDPVSEGCRNCYARRMAARLARRCGYPEAPDHFRVTLHPDRLADPLRWKEPCMVFVNSMGDLFHPDVPDGFIEQVLGVVALRPQHTFQVLTKRAQRMCEFMSNHTGRDALTGNRNYRLDNLWLGVSAENQATADERIPWLLKTPAAVRFVSCEPLLGPVDIFSHLLDGRHKWNPKLHWVIAGGETGPGARPMHPDWVRSLRNQCQDADVPFFFKGWGAWFPNWVDMPRDDLNYERAHVMVEDMAFCRVGQKAAGRLLDGREWGEMPKQL